MPGVLMEKVYSVAIEGGPGGADMGLRPGAAEDSLDGNVLLPQGLGMPKLLRSCSAPSSRVSSYSMYREDVHARFGHRVLGGAGGGSETAPLSLAKAESSNLRCGATSGGSVERRPSGSAGVLGTVDRNRSRTPPPSPGSSLLSPAYVKQALAELKIGAAASSMIASDDGVASRAIHRASASRSVMVESKDGDIERKTHAREVTTEAVTALSPSGDGCETTGVSSREEPPRSITTPTSDTSQRTQSGVPISTVDRSAVERAQARSPASSAVAADAAKASHDVAAPALPGTQAQNASGEWHMAQYNAGVPLGAGAYGPVVAAGGPPFGSMPPAFAGAWPYPAAAGHHPGSPSAAVSGPMPMSGLVYPPGTHPTVIALHQANYAAAVAADVAARAHAQAQWVAAAGAGVVGSGPWYPPAPPAYPPIAAHFPYEFRALRPEVIEEIAGMVHVGVLPNFDCLDAICIKTLADVPVDVAVTALRRLAEKDMRSVRNISKYLCRIVKVCATRETYSGGGAGGHDCGDASLSIMPEWVTGEVRSTIERLVADGVLPQRHPFDAAAWDLLQRMNPGQGTRALNQLAAASAREDLRNPWAYFSGIARAYLNSAHRGSHESPKRAARRSSADKATTSNDDLSIEAFPPLGDGSERGSTSASSDAGIDGRNPDRRQSRSASHGSRETKRSDGSGT